MMSKPASLRVPPRSLRWSSPGRTAMVASLASIIRQFNEAFSNWTRELGSPTLSSRARRSWKAWSLSSSSLVMMPSVMAWATPCFHLSSRTRSMSSSSVASSGWVCSLPMFYGQYALPDGSTKAYQWSSQRSEQILPVQLMRRLCNPLVQFLAYQGQKFRPTCFATDG